jgi:Zn-dependent protease with chaperone function
VNAPLIVVPFAVELTVLITTIAPHTLAGRFRSRPYFGIALWLFSFLLAFVSTLIALAISIWSIFDTWHELENGNQPLWHTVVFSFAPWLILGLAGISMALVAQKLDPIREARKSDAMIRDLPSTPLLNFHGLEIRVIDVPLWIAFTRGVGRGAKIYISRVAHQNLKTEELEALLWHERTHATHWHNALKLVVSLIRQLGGLMLASRVLAFEIDLLCECAADKAALKRCSKEVLWRARSKFVN